MEYACVNKKDNKEIVPQAIESVVLQFVIQKHLYDTYKEWTKKALNDYISSPLFCRKFAQDMCHQSHYR